MEFRRLGRTGLEVSELALGTMQFGWTADEDTAHAILDAFVAAGGNLVDTADIYSNWADGNPGGVSEEIIGRWMKARRNRQDIVLATKVRGRMWEGPNGEGLSRAHILRAVDESLRRLQTDYIDLYQTHWFDAATPIEETMRTLDDLVRAGKVRYMGCSNYPTWRLVEALWTADKYGLASYVSLQPHYNLAHREEFEREMVELVGRYGIGVVPYSPLERLSERNFALLEGMEQIGENHGQGVLQVALAWLLTKPLVTAPIVGANTVEQLQASLAAVGFRLTAAEMQVLDDLSDWGTA